MVKTIKSLCSIETKFQKHLGYGVFYTFLFKFFEAFPDVLLGLMINMAFHKSRSILGIFSFSSDIAGIYWLSTMVVLTWISSSFFQFKSTLHWKHAASAIQYRLRKNLAFYILNQDTTVSDRSSNESLKSDFRMTNLEIDDIEYFAHRTLEDFFRLVFSTLIIAPALLYISPLFLIYSLIVVVPTFFLAKWFQKNVRPGYNAVKSATKKMYQEVDETLSGIGVIRDFKVESRFLDKLNKAAGFLDFESRRTSFANAAMNPLTRLFVQFGVLAILVHSIFLVYYGHITFGGFAATTFLSRKFLLPFTFLAGISDLCLKGIRATNNVFATFQKVDLKADSNKPIAINSVGSLKLKSTTFSYQNKMIIQNLDSQFNLGNLNVIKGPTGVGKTTLLRLLSGDFLADSGDVFHDSVNTKDNLNFSRSNIAFVAQFPKIFTATLKENIVLFDPECDEARFQIASELSLVNEFKDQFPLGFDTVIGPNGVKISGGQMQSIAIARAIYSKARVLLLDEPTASFDILREKLFLDRLKTILNDRLVVLTSHRQQAIEAADFVLEIKNEQL